MFASSSLQFLPYRHKLLTTIVFGCQICVRDLRIVLCVRARISGLCTFVSERGSQDCASVSARYFQQGASERNPLLSPSMVGKAVIIRTPLGSCIHVELQQQSISVDELKANVANQTGFAPEVQRLYRHHGSEMSGDVQIGGGDALTLVLPFVVEYPRPEGPRPGGSRSRAPPAWQRAPGRWSHPPERGSLHDPVGLDKIAQILPYAHLANLSQGVERFESLVKKTGIDRDKLLSAILTIHRLFLQRACRRMRAVPTICASVCRYLRSRDWIRTKASLILQARLRRKGLQSGWRRSQSARLLQSRLRGLRQKLRWARSIHLCFLCCSGSVTLVHLFRHSAASDLDCCRSTSSRALQACVRRRVIQDQATRHVEGATSVQSAVQRCLASRHLHLRRSSASTLESRVRRLRQTIELQRIQAAARGLLAGGRYRRLRDAALRLTARGSASLRRSHLAAAAAAALAIQAGVQRFLCSRLRGALQAVSFALKFRSEEEGGLAVVQRRLPGLASALRRFPAQLSDETGAGFGWLTGVDLHMSLYNDALQAIRSAVRQRQDPRQAERQPAEPLEPEPLDPELLKRRDEAREACCRSAAALQATLERLHGLVRDACDTVSLSQMLLGCCIRRAQAPAQAACRTHVPARPGSWRHRLVHILAAGRAGAQALAKLPCRHALVFREAVRYHVHRKTACRTLPHEARMRNVFVAHCGLSAHAGVIFRAFTLPSCGPLQRLTHSFPRRGSWRMQRCWLSGKKLWRRSRPGQPSRFLPPSGPHPTLPTRWLLPSSPGVLAIHPPSINT